MASSNPSNEVTSSLSKLSLETNKSTKTLQSGKKKAKKVVADSWEDEDVSESEPEPEPEAVEEELDKEDSTPSKPAVPAVPPPTPASPAGTVWPAPAADFSPGRSSEPAKRPEKTDAVARRMIAAGLGLKAPKQTEEQRAYQRSIREQEKKRRELEREAEKKRLDDVEKAKKAVWDD